MHHPTDVQREIDLVAEWLDIEAGRDQNISDTIKVSICREIKKTLGANPPQPIKIALLTLILAGQVKNPFALTAVDEENARWIVRDAQIGWDPSAPVSLV